MTTFHSEERRGASSFQQEKKRGRDQFVWLGRKEKDVTRGKEERVYLREEMFTMGTSLLGKMSARVLTLDDEGRECLIYQERSGEKKEKADAGEGVVTEREGGKPLNVNYIYRKGILSKGGRTRTLLRG